MTIHRTISPLANWGWLERAACRGLDTALFVGPDHEYSVDRQIRERYAKRVCESCPVRVACLDRAIDRKESGVWGGLNDDERASERRRRLRRKSAA